MALVAKECDEIVEAANLAELVDAICTQEGVPALTMDGWHNVNDGNRGDAHQTVPPQYPFR